MIAVRLRPLAWLASLLVIGAAPAVEARHVLIDFSEAPATGNNFTFGAGISEELNLTDDGSTAAIPLGFPIDFGTGLVDSLFINENGIVSFGAPLTAPFTPVTSLASLVGGAGAPTAVIAPYYANLTSQPGNGDIFDNVSPTGEIFYQRGSADLTLDPGATLYDFTDPVQALRITWNGLGGLPDTVATQLYIYSLGTDGSFGLRFSYGTNPDDVLAAQGSLAGFILGSNTQQFTGPYDAATDYYFTVGPGGGGDPSVPEPSMVLLLAVGLLMLLAKRFLPSQKRRRRLSPSELTEPHRDLDVVPKWGGQVAV